MGLYLAILRGALGIVNTIARALQQHHDELNGRNAQIAEDNAHAAEAERAAAQALVDTDRAVVIDKLRDGSA